MSDSVIGFFAQLWAVWLMIVFVGIIAYAYWPKNKGRFHEDAMIPLRDGDEHEEGNNGGIH